MNMTENEKEILLGDYTITLWPGYNYVYDIFHHNEKIGWVSFLPDMPLRRIFTNDTDLITMLLLKYQVSPDFKIYPYNE